MIEKKKVLRDCWGHVVEWGKTEGGAAQAAHHDVEPGIDTREKWEAVKNHFQPDEPLRYPSHWDDSHTPLYLLWPTHGPTPYQSINKVKWEENVLKWKNRTNLLELEGPSMIGMIKEVMGFENFCYALYDDYELVDEIVETRTALGEAVIGKMMTQVDFDILHFWEDIAYNNGSMFDPAIVDRLTTSRYKRLIDIFKAGGGQIISLDSDGDIRELIPIWLKAGINNIWTMEYKAGMDVAKLRKEYGQAFSMRGGINKYALVGSRDEIDRELDRIAPVVLGGGYIPCLDHQIPEGIPFENFCYYMEQKKKLLGCP